MRLSAADARRLLTTADHAVLAVNDAAGAPLVVPVTVAALDVDAAACLAFAVDHKPKSGARLRRLRLVEADPRVAVLAEHYEADWTRLWWARADGRAERPRPRRRGPAAGGAGRPRRGLPAVRHDPAHGGGGARPGGALERLVGRPSRAHDERAPARRGDPVTVVRRADLAVTPWKNGLGRKADLAEGDGWFVGLAWLDRDAAFSDFPGTDRTCVLVEGAGFTLEVEGRRPLVFTEPGTAHAFPGDVPTRCVLRAGPCVVLNVMTRRGDPGHRVEVGAALPPDGWSVVLQRAGAAGRDAGPRGRGDGGPGRRGPAAAQRHRLAGPSARHGPYRGAGAGLGLAPGGSAARRGFSSWRSRSGRRG